ncbi:hypothetical protein VNO77_11946 [Canavalia gladiata]|uniref:GRAM domain-containing protein n=1 Tax=Canavalia gladiata TaxID=3824 RepID=A0AAN9LW59_CANGL
MQTSLLHELVIGTPIISETYDQHQKSVSRYLPDPATQCQCSTTSSTKQMRQGTNISETFKRKLSIGAGILQLGGVEKVFKQFFSVKEGEKLLKGSHCYLSTTSGPLAGFLFISTDKIAFCSQRSMKVFSQKGHMLRIRYKVVIPLKKIKCVNQSTNVEKPTQKYIEIMTVDNFDFWFMDVSKYQKTFKYLEQLNCILGHHHNVVIIGAECKLLCIQWLTGNALLFFSLEKSKRLCCLPHQHVGTCPVSLPIAYSWRVREFREVWRQKVKMPTHKALVMHPHTEGVTQKTSLLHELVIGTPIISETHDQHHKSVNRYLPDPATQCQCSTTSSTKQMRLGTNISETFKRKLSLGAHILQVGGVEKMFRQFFSVKEGERLLKASQCHLSTTSGPLAGFLFISTEKIAFCSQRSMKVFSQKGHMLRIRYKVVIPLKKIKCVNQSENVKKPKQKYIEIVTVDNFDFWFMGVIKYQKTLKYLEQAISQA